MRCRKEKYYKKEIDMPRTWSASLKARFTIMTPGRRKMSLSLKLQDFKIDVNNGCISYNESDMGISLDLRPR